MSQSLNDNVSPIDEKEYLNNKLQYFEKEINSVKNRLSEIDKI